jgi:hypothetical protein
MAENESRIVPEDASTPGEFHVSYLEKMPCFARQMTNFSCIWQ